MPSERRVGGGARESLVQSCATVWRRPLFTRCAAAAGSAAFLIIFIAYSVYTRVVWLEPLASRVVILLVRKKCRK